MSNRYETEREVQKVYIAYYGCPADPEGQQFWVDPLEASGGDLSAIIDAFGDADEFQEVYGELSIAELVNNLCQQLFGRDVDEEGLAFSGWRSVSVVQGGERLRRLVRRVAAGTTTGRWQSQGTSHRQFERRP